MSNFVFFSEVVATDGSGKGSNANGSLKSVVRCFINRYVAGKEVLCRKARSKPMFFTVVLAMVGMVFCMQKAEAQLARQFWFSPNSVNYTLSEPILNPINADGKWILAVSSQNFSTSLKSTIAVFMLNADYEIISSTGNCEGAASVIGLPGGTPATEGFDPYVDFEAHCVVQSCNTDEDSLEHYYIICGSMLRNAEVGRIGMVVILNADLSVREIREYPNVRVFYSAYARDDYYYVCGEMRSGTGVVLQDNVATAGFAMKVWVTNYPWTFHKIKRRDYPCSRVSNEFSVSGIGEDKENGTQVIGFCIFAINNPALLGINLVCNIQFQPLFTVNSGPGNSTGSKVAISNYPGHNINERGVILSASSDNEIQNYLFYNDYPFNSVPYMKSAFMTLPWHRFYLEDMDCGEPDRIAWVGNIRPGATTQPAEAWYAVMNVPPPFTLSTAINFIPQNAMPSPQSYYSVHKVHWNSDDNQFHAGGYYNHFSHPDDQDQSHNNYKTSFVATPEDPELADMGCTHVEHKDFNEMTLPILKGLWIWSDPNVTLVYPIEHHDGLYGFCTEDCQGHRKEDCGYRKINIKKKRTK